MDDDITIELLAHALLETRVQVCREIYLNDPGWADANRGFRIKSWEDCGPKEHEALRLQAKLLLHRMMR